MLCNASLVVYCLTHSLNCKGALKDSVVQPITQRIQVVRIGTVEIGHEMRFGEESDETIWQPGARYSSFTVLKK
jgi:hypothetical protein